MTKENSQDADGRGAGRSCADPPEITSQSRETGTIFQEVAKGPWFPLRGPLMVPLKRSNGNMRF